MTSTPYTHAPRGPDYSVVRALIRGLELLRVNYTAFSRLFPGYAPEVIASYHLALFSSDGVTPANQIPAVVVAEQSGVPRFPGIVVAQNNEQSTDAPIGGIITTTEDNVPVFRYTASFLITVECRASPRDLAKALVICAIGILFNSQKIMYEEKYNAIYYLGTSAPSAEYAYLAERQGLGGITYYEASFRITGDVDIATFDEPFPPITDILVLEKGLSLDGIPGGVAPSEV